MTSSHQPKKSLGQNFLHERVYIERIVQAVDPRPGDRLVEIGPGQGAITLPLLRRHGALTVIEFDRDLVGPLAAMAEGVGELTIVHRDVLSVDFTALAAGTPFKLCGNLPYNISSPILFHALDHAAAIRDMVFMLQKEVVDRMGAPPGSKVYGRLSVMLQAYCQVQPLFVVPPGAFLPAAERFQSGRVLVSLVWAGLEAPWVARAIVESLKVDRARAHRGLSRMKISGAWMKWACMSLSMTKPSGSSSINGVIWLRWAATAAAFTSACPALS